MNDNVKNALAVIDQAKQKGALTYMSREDCMAVTPLFKPEATLFQFDIKEDMHNISGKYAPKREVVDRIGEASGLEFVRDGCRNYTETRDDSFGKRVVYISEQQGRRRMSDGNWRMSSVQSYEFDPVLRAMDDFNVVELTPQTKMTQNRNGKTLGKAILEYQKVARQRAETGARLRVIREMTGMPTAFSAAEASKPMVFGRFAQNTDYILQTPEGRAMASAQALGIDPAALFGGRKITGAKEERLPEQETTTALPESAEQNNDSPAAYDEAPAEYENSSQEQMADAASLAEQALGNDFDSLTAELAKLCNEYQNILNVTLKSGSNPYNMAWAELDQNNFNATVETRQTMIKRVKDFLVARGVKL